MLLPGLMRGYVERFAPDTDVEASRSGGLAAGARQRDVAASRAKRDGRALTWIWSGHVDEISRSVIQGWVIDTEHPDATISISIFVNGVHRGMCLTTHARDDLVLPNGDKLSGKCGFHFEFRSAAVAIC